MDPRRNGPRTWGRLFRKGESFAVNKCGCGCIARWGYLADLQQTGERQEVHRGVELTIKMSILGTCYFV